MTSLKLFLFVKELTIREEENRAENENIERRFFLSFLSLHVKIGETIEI